MMLFRGNFFLLYGTSSVEVPLKLPYLGFENFKFDKYFHASHILTSVAVAVIIRGSERDQ